MSKTAPLFAKVSPKFWRTRFAMCVARWLACMCLDMCYAIAMKRTNFFFPEQMLARLKAASDKQGISMSEFIRNAIEVALKKIGL